LSIEKVLNSNGLDDALWCFRAVKGYDREIRLYAVWCARQAQHLMTDPRSKNVLDVVERFANGQATRKEFNAAGAASEAARASAWAALAAAGAASETASGAAARAAAWAGAKAASEAASEAAWAAAEAVSRAVSEATARAAWAGARAAQEEKMRKMCLTGARND
jgi:hypothetical protein